MLDEMTQQNASKFAIFLEYKNPRSFFFVFHFVLHTLFFLLMDALAHVDIDQGIHLGENNNKVARNAK